MVTRERNLARTGEVQVVGRKVVNLVGVCTEEPRAIHDFRSNQSGRYERRKAGLKSLVKRHVHEREFETGTNTLQEVEARARHFGSTNRVDGVEALAEFEVIFGFKVELRRRPVRAQSDEILFTSGGNTVDNEVSQS
ncbi:unannotated protein [freshwater metagenome]|uniref:Unannotated protein n=1 Tax=freshwater metagenome TaxID=449393 RepID=A0A6J6E4S8_9ZZZZ